MSGQPLFAQIKLHTYFGGGEVFAAHLAEAATALGGSSVLVVHPKARHWATMQLPDTQSLTLQQDSNARFSFCLRTHSSDDTAPLPAH